MIKMHLRLIPLLICLSFLVPCAFPGSARADEPAAKKRFEAALDDLRPGRYKSSAEGALEAAGLAPGSQWEGRGVFLAARAYAALKDEGRASALYDTARAKLPALADYSLFFLADLYSDTGRHKDAASTYKQLIAEYPESTLVSGSLQRLAGEAMELSDFPEAVSSLRALIARDPDYGTSASARYTLMKAYEGMGDHDAAMKEYRVLWLDYPDTASAGKAEAIAHLDFSPDDLLHRADRLMERGQYKAAALEFGRAASFIPEYSELYGKICIKSGVASFNVKDYGRAEAAFTLALEKTSYSKDAAEATYRLARTYLRVGEQARFRDAATACASKYPDSPRAADSLYLLGTELLDYKEYDEAIAVFRRAVEGHPGSERAEDALWQLGWSYYKKGDYAASSAAFGELMERHPGTSLMPQTLYWRAKALEGAGDPAEAEKYLRTLTTDYEASFYGMYLKTEAAKPPGMDNTLPVEPETPLDQLNAGGAHAMERAIELGLQGMRAEALRELRRAERRFGDSLDGLRSISGFYYALGDYRRPLLLASQLYKTGSETGGEKAPLSAMKLMFPLAYWDVIKREAALLEVDPLLVCSVIREESRFDPYAVSKAGAAGLMQIMPDTAKTLCRKLSKTRGADYRQSNDDFNVPLGTCYIEALLEKHNGRLVYALAEYNAGPSALANWVGRRPGEPDDEFIEGIGYTETRNYVKRVLRNYFMYRKLYGEEKPSPPSEVTPPRSPS